MSQIPCCNRCFLSLPSTVKPGARVPVCKNCGAIFHSECSVTCTVCGVDEFTLKKFATRTRRHPKRRAKHLKPIRIKQPKSATSRQRRNRQQRPPISFDKLLISILTVFFFGILFLGSPAVVDSLKEFSGISYSMRSMIVVPQLIFAVIWIALRPRKVYWTILLTLLFGGYCWWIQRTGYLEFDKSQEQFHFMVFALLFFSLWVSLLWFSAHRVLHPKLSPQMFQPVDSQNRVVLFQLALVLGLMLMTLLGAYQLFKFGWLTWTDSEDFTIYSFLNHSFVSGLITAGVFVSVVSICVYRIFSKQSGGGLFLLMLALGLAFYFRGAILQRINRWSGFDTMESDLMPRQRLKQLFENMNEAWNVDLTWLHNTMLNAWLQIKPASLMAAIILILAFGLSGLGYELRVRQNQDRP